MKLSRFLTISTAVALLSTTATYAQAPNNNNGAGANGAAPKAAGAGKPAASAAGGGSRRRSRGGPTSQPAAKPATPPWLQAPFKLPAKTVTLDFRNASIDAVLHYFSQASGIAIIKDPALTGGVTLQSPKPQKLADAFDMLNVVLGLKGDEIGKQGNFLIARTKQAQAAPAGRPGGFNFPGGFPGGASGNVLDYYTLQYANATSLATTVNEVYAQTPNTGQQNRGGFGGPFGGGAAIAAAEAAAAAAGTQRTPTVHASADDYSNTLIVNAPQSVQTEVATMIQQVDRPTTQPMQAKVFVLQYALASDLQPTIQEVLSGATPTGRGSTTASNAQSSRNNNPFRFFFGGGGGNSANGTVSADTTSNSLVVTATAQTLAQVATVIQQLDKPAAYESTTFVYVLKSARADVVANLLNEAFGNRTTNGQVGGSLTNTGLTQQTQSNNGSTTSPEGLGTTTRSGNTTNFTVTSNTQNATPATTGLDEQGHVVNIRNLTGQVLLVPNIDTNSIIVVTPPEDKKLVENILDEMDVLPEQVMIETAVLEVTLTDADQFGFEYSVTQNNPFGGVHGTVTAGQNFGLQSSNPQGLDVTLTAGQYKVFMNALQTNTKFNVLSTPRIMTTNNATSQINVSESLPYITNSTVDALGNQIIDYGFLPVGLVLTVTPRITSSGIVMMDVTQTADNFIAYTSFNAPETNQRQTQTTVSVEDGNTVMLGGIINTQDTDTLNKIPLLGDIPIIGSLFRSTSKSKQKTELLVFLTPHIIHDQDDANRARIAEEAGLSKTALKELPKSTTDLSPGATPPSGGGG